MTLAHAVVGFRWDVPERFNFCADVLDRHDPERLAMHWADDDGNERLISFGDFHHSSRRLAAGLAGLGVEPGDTVLILLPRVTAWWDVMLACLRGGFVACPGTTQLRAKDLAYRLPTSEAVAIVTDEDGVEVAEAALALCGHELKLKIVVREEREDPPRAGWIDLEAALGDPGDWIARDTRATDPALLYFTSGTTGLPKMTLHSQASAGIGHRTSALWLGVKPGDLHWNLSDTGWAKAAYSSLFGPWISGATLFVQHSTRFDAAATLALLARHPITSFCGAPTLYRMLVQEDLSAFAFPALRECLAAGEPLNPEIVEVWKRHTGLTIRDGYGQTETTLLVGNYPGAEIRPGSMGLVSPGYDVDVIDAEGRRCPTGEEGEIAVATAPERPAGLFMEYWKDPERTAAVFTGDWYRTGDRAVRDEDGYFWFVGRDDDVILTAGYRIGPFEVESALLEHPSVAESAVVASPDAERGEIVKAFVVLAKGHAPSDELIAELQGFVREHTAPYKYPRAIEFVAELPKTISGKIRRIDLRAREGTRPAGD